LSLSADGKTLVSRGAGQVFRWNLATGEGTARPDDVKDPDGFIPDVPFPKLAYRAGRYRIEREFGSGEIEVRTRDGSKSIAKTSCPKDGGFRVAGSADGRTVAVSFLDRDSTILLWSPETRAEPLRLTGHPDACLRMAFTHDGRHLIAGAGQQDAYPTETVFVYETTTGKLVRKLATNRTPTHLLVTADDRTLITGGRRHDETVKVWDLATGKELATLVDPGVAAPGVAEPPGGGVAVSGLALSADERFLAAVTGHAGSSSVTVWDTGSWKLIKAFPPARPQAHAASVVVARDGRSVFVAYHDSTILEWAVTDRPGKAAIPTAARLDELWRTLGDPERGYAAAWELLDHPAEAVALVKSKLSPAAPLDPKAVTEVVRKLGSDVFREREEAGKKLVALGEAAVPLVRSAAGGDLSAEGKDRAEKVIAALTAGLAPEHLRQRRAVAVLEWSQRPEAVEHLRTLAKGDPNARLTTEARAALRR
jgi:hypothetical protein